MFVWQSFMAKCTFILFVSTFVFVKLILIGYSYIWFHPVDIVTLWHSFWLVTAISGFIQLISSPYDTHSDWLQLSLVSSSWNRHLMTLILIGYSYLWFHPVDIVTLWHSFWLVTAISGFIQLISSPSDHENQVKC